jgi:uncharacterized metal-binding protein YceD (DUF177 family)
MSEQKPEFSRLVPLTRLGAEPYYQEIEATSAEREAVARRFDLVSLDRLAARVSLARKTGDAIRLDAEFEAEFLQSCVVSLEPVAGTISQSFTLVYGAEGQQEEIVLAVDEPAFEPLSGEAIDIGEAVAQELSLALPDFPRGTDAAVEPSTIGEPDDGRFAALGRWRGSPRD